MRNLHTKNKLNAAREGKAAVELSTSLNTTLTTFGTLMKRLGVDEANKEGPPKTNAEPFRIQDYGQTAGRLETAARQLTELLHTFDQTLGSTNLTQLPAQVEPVVRKAQAGGKELLDCAFWKGVHFVGLVLASALIYRILGARLTPALNSKAASP